MQQFIPCVEKQLPAHQIVAAAQEAIQQNPANRPRRLGVIEALASWGQNAEILTPYRLAVMTTKYWGAKGVNLSVSFMDGGAADLKARILSHMNAWGAYCNAKFSLTNGVGQVRITRGGGGYWSYLGVDILSIPQNQPTMNLQGFSMNTPESEYHRVVRHETGHTLGFPHEHMRQELVARLDVNKTIEYFAQNQGWSPQVTREQVLTPLSQASIRGTPNADQDSIMCYQLPGSITIDGEPIRGGVDIDPSDQSFSATLYPLAITPPNPPEPPVKPIVIPGFLKDLVDQIFDQLIASSSGFSKWGLQLAKMLFDRWASQNAATAMQQVGNVSQLQEIIDGLFDKWIASTTSEFGKQLLSVAKMLIDQLLATAPQNAACQLSWIGPKAA